MSSFVCLCYYPLLLLQLLLFKNNLKPYYCTKGWANGDQALTRNVVEDDDELLRVLVLLPTTTTTTTTI